MGMVNDGGTDGLSGNRSTRKRSLTEGGDLGSGAFMVCAGADGIGVGALGTGAGALGICAGARTAVAAKKIPAACAKKMPRLPLPRTIPGSHAIDMYSRRSSHRRESVRAAFAACPRVNAAYARVNKRWQSPRSPKRIGPQRTGAAGSGFSVTPHVRWRELFGARVFTGAGSRSMK